MTDSMAGEYAGARYKDNLGAKSRIMFPVHRLVRRAVRQPIGDDRGNHG